MKRTIVTALAVVGFTIGLAAQGGGGRQGGPAPNETLSQTFRESHGRDVAYQLSLPGFKIFDNVWFMGLASQGAFVITTSQGLILIDTLNSTEEARDILVPSMQKVGLDPAQIKYIVLSHGHPGQTDHTGGANYLQRTYHPRVMMGTEDWDATLPAQKPERPLAQRDVDIRHGDTLTLGDEMGADGILNAHPGIYQDTLADMETIRKNPGGANPLLYGRERAARYWKIMDDCATARVVALEQAVGTK